MGVGVKADGGRMTETVERNRERGDFR